MYLVLLRSVFNIILSSLCNQAQLLENDNFVRNGISMACPTPGAYLIDRYVTHHTRRISAFFRYGKELGHEAMTYLGKKAHWVS